MKNNFSKKALSVILTLIMILSAFPITAVEGFAATTYTSGDFEYTVLNNEVTITKYKGSEVELVIPSTLDGYSVTTLGNYAFSDCTSLISVTISDGVTYIDSYAFYGCESLESITIPDSVSFINMCAFDYCLSLNAVYIIDLASWCNINFHSNPLSYAHNLYINGVKATSITIPDSITSIGSSVFSGCTSLESITIPNSVTSIGSSAFNGCTSLERITIPDSVTSIGSSAFNGCTSLTSIYVSSGNSIYDSRNNCNAIIETVTNTLIAGCKSTVIPDSVTSIGDYAFKGCTSLTSITIPDSVISIGNSAFSNCASLTSITIPDSVTSIGYFAFSGCTSLTNIIIPDSITSISWDAFSNCTSLTSITIPDSVTSIGSSAFKGCTSLERITIPDSVTSIGGSAFYGCTSLTSVIIPASVTSIGNIVFNGCSALKDVIVNYNPNCSYSSIKYNITELIIPNGVTNIGNSAFSGYNKLASITIPDSVTSIGDSAFSGCTSLKSVTIPEGVISIGDSTFYGCTSLTSTTIPRSVTTISNSAFTNSNLSNSITVYYNPNTDYTSLKSNIATVILPEEMTKIEDEAFKNYTYLKSVTIPDSVTNIGERAFCNCSLLTSVTIPDSVTSIGDNAFDNCSSLTIYGNSYSEAEKYANNNSIPFISTGVMPLGYIYNLKDDSTAEITGYRGYADTAYIPSVIDSYEVTSISASAFENCITLTSVTIPDGVTSIGDSAFSGCTSLISVTIPASVTSIGSNVFNGCSALEEVIVNYNPNCSYSNVKTAITEVIIPNSVTSIGSSAFYGCTSLKSIAIPNSVTNIGYQAFYNCSKLNAVYITDLAAWSNISFNNSTANPLYYAHNLYLNNELVENAVIPDGAAKIGNYAFFNFESLKSITIPDSVTSIGREAFSGCDSLTSVTIGNGVTSIGSKAFAYCYMLESITVPYTVKFVAYDAFDTDTLKTFSGYIGSPIYRLIKAKNAEIYNGLVNDLSNYKNSDDYDEEVYNTYLETTYNEIKINFISLGKCPVTGCVYKVEQDWQQDSEGNEIITDYAIITAFNGYTSEMVIPAEIDGYEVRGVSLYGEFCNDNYAAGYDFIESVVFEDGITKINENALLNMTSVKDVTIPASVTEIEGNPFINTDDENNSTSNLDLTIHGYAGSAAERFAIEYGFRFDAIGVVEFTGFVYEVVDETCCTITGCKGAPVGNIVIPETIDGFTVTGLGERAFYGATLLEGITIPDSVINIDEGAFFSCNSLQSVTVGANNPIYYVDDGVLYVREVIGEENGQYIYSDNLTLVLYPSAKTGEEFTIPANVVSIYSDAFGICKNLKHLIIPETLTDIDWLSNAEIDDITLHFNFSAEYAGFNGNNDNRAKITEIIIPEGTVTIDSYVIYSYSSLKRIIIPDSVKNINFVAFLESIVEEGIYIPESVENIEPGAFALMLGDIIVDSENPYYSSENGVLFNKAKTELIAVPPFKSNNTAQYSLQQLLEMSENLKEIKNIITDGYEIPNSVIHIADYAFALNYAKNIEIPYSVVSIGKSAFASSYLESVTIPDSVETIGEYAFSCENLKRVFIPDSVTSIGENAFVSEVIFGYTGTCAETYANENNITFIALDNLIKGDINYDGVVDIADYAVMKTDLKEVNFSEAEIPAEEMYLVDFNNDNAFDAFDMYYLDRVINDLDADRFDYEIISGNEIKITGYEGTQTKLTIPSTIDGYTVTQIGANAFDGNTRLKRIVIPKTVTQIGNYAFKGCSSLESVSLPNGLTNIRYGSFLNCSKLYVLRIPDTVTSVGSYAFKGCSSLKGVTVSDSMTAIGNGVFSNCSELEEIYIPRSVTSINSNAFDGHNRDLIVYGFVDSYAYTFVNNSTDEHLGYGTIAWVCDGDNCEACKKSHDENGMSYPCAEGGVHVAPKEFWKCKGNLCPVCQQHQDNYGKIIECTDHSWMESYIRDEIPWLSDVEVAQEVAAMENRCTCGLVTETYPDCTCHYQLPPSNYITIPVSN